MPLPKYAPVLNLIFQTAGDPWSFVFSSISDLIEVSVLVAFQFEIRPSEFVTAVNVTSEFWQESMADMLAAGRPAVVSRTWQVIGSLAAIAVEKLKFD